MASKKESGQWGEQLAVDFLKQKGFDLLHRNYRHKRSEIDLIVCKKELLVFVEVKARKTKWFGEPESFVSAQQAERIVMAAEQFVFERDWQGAIRFDIVAVTYQPQLEIYHLEDAFY